MKNYCNILALCIIPLSGFAFQSISTVSRPSGSLAATSLRNRDNYYTSNRGYNPTSDISSQRLESKISLLENKLLGQGRDIYSRNNNGRYNNGYSNNNGYGNNRQSYTPDEMFWINTPKEEIQGASLKTWSFDDEDVETVQLRLETEGRPLDANIELWNGPDNTPQKIKVYSEDGQVRPFTCAIMTPRGPNSVAIRNTAELEFPFAASVLADYGYGSSGGPMVIPSSYEYKGAPIQGGALQTFAFEPYVDSVMILLNTDGRPLNAKIELLQGPNNNKQVIEVYTEDGFDRPFYVVIATPGSGNVVRVVNKSTVEFPMNALVVPYDEGNNRQYGNNNRYSGNRYNSQYGNSQYGNSQYGNSQYGNSQYGNSLSQYGSSLSRYGTGDLQSGSRYGNYGNSQYGNYGNYGNSQYGSRYGNSQYGNYGNYGNSQYGSRYNSYGSSNGDRFNGDSDDRYSLRYYNGGNRNINY